MPIRNVFLYAGLLATCAVAARAGAQTGSFSGTVVDGNGQPVSGAIVTYNNVPPCTSSPSGGPICQPPLSSSATSAADGTFSAANLRAGWFYVCARAVTAYQLASCDWLGYGNTGPQSVTVPAGGQAAGIQLILRSGTQLLFTVRDDRGLIPYVGFIINVSTNSFFVNAAFDSMLEAYKATVPNPPACR